MIAYWRAHRPKMTARLERLGILAEFAHVMETNRSNAEQQNRQAGMYWTDAAEQAEQAWTLMTPEAEDPEPTDDSEEAGSLPPGLLRRMRAALKTEPPSR
jgi:hypothetical protein